MATDNNDSVSLQSVGGMTFAMQIGLVRESVTVEGGDPTISTLKDIACAFVDRKVSIVVDLGDVELMLVIRN